MRRTGEGAPRTGRGEAYQDRRSGTVGAGVGGAMVQTTETEEMFDRDGKMLYTKYGDRLLGVLFVFGFHITVSSFEKSRYRNLTYTGAFIITSDTDNKSFYHI